MITEDYVSFEIAKLLKEKGFGADSHYYYDKDGDLFFTAFSVNNVNTSMVAASTLQMAMKWLKETHDIFISPRIEVSRNEEETGIHQYGQPVYYVIITYVPNGNTLPYQGWVYEKQEEACEAAIKYCLENLI